MQVTRIKRIRDHRVFRDFTWPSDLSSFARFNLIYGWNGSGKTTLSGLFRFLETRTAVTDGEVVFELDEKPVAGRDLPTAALPPVRVFNREFVTASVLASGGEFAPIYYFGKEGVEKQRQVERLQDDLAAAEKERATAEAGRTAADKALDEFCINQGKIIREAMRGPRSTGYHNYDKRQFRQSIERLTEETQRAGLLSDAEKTSLRAQIVAPPKDPVSRVIVALPQFAELATRVRMLAGQSVVSQVIETLAADQEVSTWIHQGLGLHSGVRETTTCRFCGQELRATRRQELEAHFNDAFARFQTELKAVASNIESERTRLARFEFPDPARVYEHLVNGLAAAVLAARSHLAKAAAYLETLCQALEQKRQNPFAPAPEPDATPPVPDSGEIERALGAVNAVINQHNDTTADFQQKVLEACSRLEQGYVADAFDEFRKLTDRTAAAASALQAASTRVQEIRDRIGALELEIVEHQRPAEEINAELCAYLGRDDLQLTVSATGYTMTRRGQPAGNLSEGEKTAIAFLYFLKSLQDKSFDLASGVVVVDDPVSSLDANALFSAFGYMKERTKEAGQLFVLTHSFAFFSQVRYWYHKLPGQKKKKPDIRPARFYLLRTYETNGEREAVLAKLDPLLEEHDSEYHYLFKRVQAEAARGDDESSLGECYIMPNLARRLLEAFLSFRLPDKEGDLTKQFDDVVFDEAKKARILRFVHTHSHCGHVAEPGHDPSILSETRAVLADVLALMEAVDGEHYRRMLALVAETPSEDAADE